MIAMQYSFTLPADYDMSIIDRRIRDKGTFTDGFPHLVFKAYLTAVKGDAKAGARANLYAPFYVWDSTEGLNNFVCGPGFAGVSASFGRPQVMTWIPWATETAANIREACFASREIIAIEANTDLAELRGQLANAAAIDVETSLALASVVAFEPSTWTGVRFRLLRQLPEIVPPNVQIYRVGHISLSASAV